MSTEAQDADSEFARGLARAFAGGLIFGLPLLMTMEMWWLGFYVESWRLVLLIALFFPFLVVLSWHAGFEPTFSWKDDVVDAFVAYAVGFVLSAVGLALLGIVDPSMSARELIGKVALQAVPASIGALLAQSQMGERKASEPSQDRRSRYASELFIMAVGALFLAFNLAPTQEMQVIALRMTHWHTIALMALSLAVMHAFVYSVGFQGAPDNPRGASASSLFLRFTVVGYAVAAVLSAYMLWSFGRLEGVSLANCIKHVAVLAFPAAVGAAAARLIL